MDTQIDACITGMTTQLCQRLIAVLEAVMAKLARFDEGSLIGSILTIAVSEDLKENLNQHWRIPHKG